MSQVAMLPELRAFCTLSHVDYADAFLVEAGPAHDKTAVQWARAILEGASASTLTRLLAGWKAIGLDVGGGDPARTVLGWEIIASTVDFVLLGARSHIGMPVQLLFKREDRDVLMASFVQHDNEIARAVWSVAEGHHLHFVAGLLDEARTRLRHRPPAQQGFPQEAKMRSMLAFRDAVESRQFNRIAELLAEDVVFRSPVTFNPYQGRDAVMVIINVVSTILDEFTYDRQLTSAAGNDHALVFEARVGELSIQGCDFLRTNADGLIDELTVMFRPLKAVLAFKDQMGPQLAVAMQAMASKQTATL